jgi:hypothetical protein
MLMLDNLPMLRLNTTIDTLTDAKFPTREVSSLTLSVPSQFYK